MFREALDVSNLQQGQHFQDQRLQQENLPLLATFRVAPNPVILKKLFRKNQSTRK